MRLPWIVIHDQRKRRREDKVSKGYDFAAGALLRGEETPMSLESKFRHGCDAAMYDVLYDSFLDAFDRNCFCVDDDREY